MCTNCIAATPGSTEMNSAGSVAAKARGVPMRNRLSSSPRARPTATPSGASQRAAAARTRHCIDGFRMASAPHGLLRVAMNQASGIQITGTTSPQSTARRTSRRSPGTRVRGASAACVSRRAIAAPPAAAISVRMTPATGAETGRRKAARRTAPVAATADRTVTSAPIGRPAESWRDATRRPPGSGDARIDSPAWNRKRRTGPAGRASPPSGRSAPTWPGSLTCRV